jgi:DNA-binding MarR family transcriptional regulator
MTEEPRRDRRIEQTLTFQLLVAVNRIVQPFQERYGSRFDITLPEWRCMMALSTEPDSSGEDVARKMSMDKMGVSRSLRRLEKHGRVERRTDEGNRKRNMWRLTDAGWALFDTIMPEALARDRQAFARLDEAERQRMIRVLAEFQLD